MAKPDVPTTDGMAQSLIWFKEALENEMDAKIALHSGRASNALEGVAVDGTVQPVKNKIAILGLSAYIKKTDISSGFHYKGSVNNFSDLPKSGQEEGDMYNILTAGGNDVNGDPVKAGDNVAWTGKGWDVLSGMVDLSNCVMKVVGKDLSSNDFTNAEKAKLASLSNTAPYTLPAATSKTLGGVKVGTGLSMNGDTLNCTMVAAPSYVMPTASTTTKGGVKVGHGLVMQGEVLNATATTYTLPTASSLTKGGVKVGAGLSMNGDTLNVTLQSGEKYSIFGGASATAGGASGLVPSPKAGDNTKFLRGDGQWAVANNITVISGAVTVPPNPQAFDGALWEDVIGNDPVLKMRYGDYEFNFNYDTKNYTGTTRPVSPEDAQLYMLDTVPSTNEGTLWYNVTQSTYFPIPALCLHAGNFDYGYNYDTITYKGDNTGLVAYLPLQTGIADAMGNQVTSTVTPLIEPFTINGTTYRGLRNVDTSSTGTKGTSNHPCLVTLNKSLTVCTIDGWITVLSANTVNAGSFFRVALPSGADAVNYTASSGAFAFPNASPIATNTGYTTGRHHVAVTYTGSQKKLWVNGKQLYSVSSAKQINGLYVLFTVYGTGASAYIYMDHVRIWNKVVWDEPFTPPLMSDYP